MSTCVSEVRGEIKKPFVVDHASTPPQTMTLVDMMARFTPLSLKLQVTDMLPMNLRIGVFKFPTAGCRTFFCVQDIYDHCKMTSCSGSSTTWVHSRLATWSKLPAKIGVPEDHIQRSMEYCSSRRAAVGRAHDDDAADDGPAAKRARVLPFVGVSSHMLVALIIIIIC